MISFFKEETLHFRLWRNSTLLRPTNTFIRS